MSSLDLKPVEKSAGLFFRQNFKVVKMSYVNNIATSILSRAHGVAVLGPDLYTAIAEWEKREIPAAIVLISIDEVRTLQEGRAGEELPVELFHEVVSRNFATWLANADGAVHRSV